MKQSKEKRLKEKKMKLKQNKEGLFQGGFHVLLW
jgi:hypothetical protein